MPGAQISSGYLLSIVSLRHEGIQCSLFPWCLSLFSSLLQACLPTSTQAAVSFNMLGPAQGMKNGTEDSLDQKELIPGKEPVKLYT